MIKIAPLSGNTGRKIIYTDETALPTEKVGGQNLILGDILFYLGSPAQQMFWTGTKWATNLVSSVYGSLTAAKVNAGEIVIPAKTGMKIKITGIKLQAIGGAAAGATSVDVADTAGTVFAACAVANLTKDTVVNIDSMTIANINAALAADKGVKIQKDGGDLTTATHINYIIEYCCA